MKKLFFALIFIFTFSMFFLTAVRCPLYAEDVTITTYYPAPSGVYKELASEIYYDYDDLAYQAGGGDYFLDPYPDPAAPVPYNDLSLTVEGKVGIGTTSPQARLDVYSTAGGILIPRMNVYERTYNIPTPIPNGLLIYQTDSTPGFYYYKTSAPAGWVRLASGGGSTDDPWLLTGNDSTNPANDFIGTTDNAGLAVRTNNIERMRVTNTGNVGIGTTNPLAGLSVFDEAILATGLALGSTGITPVAGSGARMMWVPAKRAFRAGFVNGNQWDDANIGLNSVAMGFSATASNLDSFAVGSAATASNQYATAIGREATASGENAIALSNYQATATGNGAMAIGYRAVANGNGAIAIGNHVQATGSGSMVIGRGYPYTDDYLVNAEDYSLRVAFNSRFPTVIIRAPNPQNMWGTGCVYIATDTQVPAGSLIKLYVKDNVYVNGSGEYTGTWTDVSDVRLKTNIKQLTGVLSKIRNINGVKFNWRADDYPNKNLSKEKQIGIIAQEMEKEYPELVVTHHDGFKGLEYNAFTAVLLEAIKEQQKQIEELNKKVAVLEKSSK